jgi:hypothetical protein
MKIFKDLYADMRDRKLLPLVAVLLVAIVAVPLLLSTEPEPSTPSTTSTEVPEGVPTAAVLASNPGLRDYRQRLRDLSSKNPFGTDPSKIANEAAKAQVEAVTDAAADAGLGEAISGGGGGGAPSEDVAETINDSSTSVQSDVTVNEGSGGNGNGNGGNGGNGGETDPEVLAFRVDVEVGQAGDLKRRKNVKLLTVLPSQSNPVNLFLGASEDGNHAVFLVSEDVVTARGDGRCVPSPANCQFVNLKRGDEMRFGYASNGGDPDTFVLKVLDISLEANEDTADADRAASSNPVDALQAWLGG